ncbi:MAG: metallophosphoesterase family protein [Candidatus Helarchaeota archaeon]
MIRVVFTTDLHGKKNKFQKFFNLDANLYIIGGDLLSIGGSFTEIYQNQLKFAQNYLYQILKEKKHEGEKLIMCGNDDFPFFENCIEKWEKEGLCKQLNGRNYIFEGIEIIGFKYVPPTPFVLKHYERRDEREIGNQILKPVIFDKNGNYKIINFKEYLKKNKSISELLEELPKPRDFSKTIYIMHSPPFNCKLDTVYDGRLVGSIDIRKFIEKNQPNLVLCGHIHECRGTSYIGETRCMNDGQIGKKFHYIDFEIDNAHIKNIQIKEED